MGAITPEEFEQPDPVNPDYSHVEYDLYASTGLSIRKNLKTGYYEIFKIKTGEVEYRYRELDMIVRRANEIEDAENTWIE